MERLYGRNASEGGRGARRHDPGGHYPLIRRQDSGTDGLCRVEPRAGRQAYDGVRGVDATAKTVVGAPGVTGLSNPAPVPAGPGRRGIGRGGAGPGPVRLVWILCRAVVRLLGRRRGRREPASGPGERHLYVRFIEIPRTIEKSAGRVGLGAARLG